MLSKCVQRSGHSLLCKWTQPKLMLLTMTTTVAAAVSTTNANSHFQRRLFSSKGEDRVDGRLAGLLLKDAQIEEAMKEHYDEEGSYTPPHASTFPSMSRRDVMMNVRIPPLGIEPPPFGEDHIREITEKTTITRENISWAREHWIDDKLKADEKNYKAIWEDIMEMYKKGVGFATINLWIDHISGADIGCKHAIYNKTWARIDS